MDIIGGFNKCVAYYRVSTTKQGNSGLGLEAQQEAVRSYLGAHPDVEFKEIESGKKNDRPELEAAIREAKLRDCKLVIAKLDRLSRDVGFLFKLKDDLTKAGVEVVAADMPDILSNTLMLSVMAGFAQHEREMISKRTKDALAAAKARGVKLGGYREVLGATLRRPLRSDPDSPQSTIRISGIRLISLKQDCHFPRLQRS